MKTILLGASLVGILASGAGADVASVRREVAHINALKISTKSSDRSDLSAEGAQILVGRDAKSTPRKIVAHIYGESGRRDDTIYLQGGKALFRLSVEERYARPIGVSSHVKIVSRVETRLYFSGGNLIQERIGKKVMTLTQTQKSAIERETVASINSYLGKDEPRG